MHTLPRWVHTALVLGLVFLCFFLIVVILVGSTSAIDCLVNLSHYVLSGTLNSAHKFMSVTVQQRGKDRIFGSGAYTPERRAAGVSNCRLSFYCVSFAAYNVGC